MQRRDFIKLSAVFGAFSAFPLLNYRAFAASYPILPIPPLLEPDSQGQITLNIQSGKSRFKDSITTTWGYNGELLGPALRLRKGRKVSLLYNNQLTEATTVHLHGLEVPGHADGGPQATIEPGKSRKSEFLVNQPAATCWFHPHPHHISGYHVAMGLGGLILIEDDESDALPLPKIWGVDDIPVILQDKRLNSTGQIDYKMDVINAAIGWFGDLMLTNGAIYPQHTVPRGWVRLRFLNGCNARSLKLSTSDKRPMYVIASDGGFLSEPTPVTELPILMGERFEVLIDTSDGSAFDIMTLPVIQIGMTLPPFDDALPVLRIETTLQIGQKKLPDTLVTLPALPTISGLTQRTLQLSMDPQLDILGMEALVAKYGKKAMAGMSMDAHGKMDMPEHGSMKMNPQENRNELDLFNSNFINGQPFNMMKPMFNVKKGQYEKWTISGEGDMMLHPFHIHGTQFRIISENGKPPAEHRSGWKDTVHVEGKVSEVLVKFDHEASMEDAFMAHCHLLEHEDTGMMMSFTVS